MKCVYDSGEQCYFFNIDDIASNPKACCPKDGACRASEDPDPSWCSSYESNSICSKCGGDFNNEETAECNCEW